MKTYYKLSEIDLNRLVSENIISENVKDALTKRSLQRNPGKFANSVLQFSLDKNNTIFISSIHFYGGEHFKKPYYFLAEIYSVTTNSAFSRFMNRKNLQWVKNKLPFHY